MIRKSEMHRLFTSILLVLVAGLLMVTCGRAVQGEVSPPLAALVSLLTLILLVVLLVATPTDPDY